MTTAAAVDNGVGLLLTQGLISVIGLLFVLVVFSSAFAGCFKRKNKAPSRSRD